MHKLLIALSIGLISCGVDAQSLQDFGPAPGSPYVRIGEREYAVNVYTVGNPGPGGLGYHAVGLMRRAEAVNGARYWHPFGDPYATWQCDAPGFCADPADYLAYQVERRGGPAAFVLGLMASVSAILQRETGFDAAWPVRDVTPHLQSALGAWALVPVIAATPPLVLALPK